MAFNPENPKDCRNRRVLRTLACPDVHESAIAFDASFPTFRFRQRR